MYLQIFTSPVLKNSSSILEVTLNLSLDDVNIDTLQVHTLLTGILTSCSLMLHIFVMIVLVVERKRFEIGDIYVFAIVVVNFLVLLFHSSTIPVSTLLRKWPFGEVACALTGSVYLVGTDLRLAFLIGLSIHRYCNVIFPFAYPKRRSTIVATMMVSIIVYITIIHTWYLLVSVVFFDITWPTCDTQRHRDTSLLLKMALTVVQSATLLTGIIPFILYVIMWKKALEIKKKIGSWTSTSQNSLVPNTDRYSQARQCIQDSIILREKKALFILLVMLMTGTPTTIIIYMEKFAGSATFGLESATSSLIIQYALTEVTLASPYMDLLVLMSAQGKRTAIKSFRKKCRSFFKSCSLTKPSIV